MPRNGIICIVGLACSLAAPAQPSLYPGGILNAASYSAGALAPGSLVAAFGDFGLSSAAQAQNTPLPGNLAGLSIQFSGGVSAPLLYVSGGQVNFQVPWEVSGQQQVALTVTVNGQISAPQTKNVALYAPGLFTVNDEGAGQGAILGPGYGLVDASYPAIAGTTIVQIFGTGLGPVTNQPPSGAVAPSGPFAETTTTPTVTIGGMPATVSYSGLAPGLVGVYQVNALVPAGAPSGDAVPVTVSFGDITSNTVTMAVTSGGPSFGGAWTQLGRDATHGSLSETGSQPLQRIRWQTPVDLAPQFSDNEILIHYGTPLVTAGNTAIVPVKTGAAGGFRVEGRSGADGSLLWTQTTDYVLPPHDWTPEFGPALTPQGRLYFPGAGGTVYYRDSPDSASGNSGQLAFYGLTNYLADPQAYGSSVIINTPITADAAGNIYFGFLVTGSNPSGLTSGIARISADGQGTWTPVTTAAGDNSMTEVVYNCAPALNTDLGLLYAAVSDSSAGYLVALDAATLAPRAHVRLKDPLSGGDALLDDDGSGTPTVGPDGDVYFGVLENPLGANHYRGWRLHFDSLLSQSKTPGAFGWDNTASVVPGSLVPSYQGNSAYLLMTKYNDYGYGGSAANYKIAILDPNGTETDAVTGVPVMSEVLTVAGSKEWCINAAAVDPVTRSVLANSEDGNLYRWDLVENKLSETVTLTPGIGEAYTPTTIGPDGTVYAINNATLFAVGQ